MAAVTGLSGGQSRRRRHVGDGSGGGLSLSSSLLHRCQLPSPPPLRAAIASPPRAQGPSDPAAAMSGVAGSAAASTGEAGAATTTTTGEVGSAAASTGEAGAAATTTGEVGSAAAMKRDRCWPAGGGSGRDELLPVEGDEIGVLGLELWVGGLGLGILGGFFFAGM